MAIIVALGFVAALSVYAKAQLEKSPFFATPTPIVLPTFTPVPETPIPTVNPDPIIKCNINTSCGGGSKQLKQSVCNNMICCLYDAKCGGPKFVNKSQCGSNITCCGLNDGSWTIMDNDQCNKVHNADKSNTTTQVVTQPSTGLNYYCYDNTLKYWYYTSSGEQCNKDNLISSCKGIIKSTYDMCMGTCLNTANQNGHVCVTEYVSGNATIQDSPDLYKQCSDKVSADMQACDDVCAVPYVNSSNTCRY
jgi:hypothetical protein